MELDLIHRRISDLELEISILEEVLEIEEKEGTPKDAQKIRYELRTLRKEKTKLENRLEKEGSSR